MNFRQHHQRGTLTAAKRKWISPHFVSQKKQLLKDSLCQSSPSAHHSLQKGTHSEIQREKSRDPHRPSFAAVITETLVSRPQSRSEITLDPLLTTIAMQGIMFLQRSCCPYNPRLKEILSKQLLSYKVASELRREHSK